MHRLVAASASLWLAITGCDASSKNGAPPPAPLAPSTPAAATSGAAAPAPPRPPPPPAPPGAGAPPAPHPAAAATGPTATAAAEVSGSASATSARAASPSRVEAVTFASEALGVSKRYQTYLPAGYDGSAERFPVVFMLHGLGGDETNWLVHGNLKEIADAVPLRAIVVMPDGDAGFYVNGRPTASYDACLAEKPAWNPGEAPASFCVRSPRYEDYVTRDLVREVDARYRTIADRRARGIGGLSMGGFGTMTLAMRHPDLFGAAASHSGLVSLLYVAPHPYAAGSVRLADTPAAWGAGYPERVRDHIRAVLGPSFAEWRDHDPVTLAGRLAPGSLALYLDCGTTDGYKFQDHASHLHDVLTQRGIEHTFALAPGGHEWGYWKARLPESLRFFAAKLTAPSR